MYADDTSVFLSGDDLNAFMCLLTKELELLFIWLKSNKLSLNTQNIFYPLFHRAMLKGNNSVVKINDCVKNKVSRGHGIIFNARTVLNQKYLLTLYNSFVYPYLIYCIEIWGTTSQIHLQPQFLAQKKVVRIIAFSPYITHTQALFNNNNNNNCLKSNIQCIEIRVQWTVHLGSSHMHVHAVTRVHAVTPKLVICVMYLTSI